MLTISSAISAGQAQTYHQKEFTAKEQSYWSQKQPIEGEWQGKLAEKFGLADSVGTQEFARLSQGQHPFTVEQLVQHRTAHQYKDERGKTVTSMSSQTQCKGRMALRVVVVEVRKIHPLRCSDHAFAVHWATG